MKRKDFFKAIGVMAITSLLGKETSVVSPIKELSNPKGLAIDLNALDKIPNALSLMEILRIYEQTGQIIYKGTGKPIIVPIISKDRQDAYNEKLKLLAEGMEMSKKYDNYKRLEHE